MKHRNKIFFRMQNQLLLFMIFLVLQTSCSRPMNEPDLKEGEYRAFSTCSGSLSEGKIFFYQKTFNNLESISDDIGKNAFLFVGGVAFGLATETFVEKASQGPDSTVWHSTDENRTCDTIEILKDKAHIACKATLNDPDGCWVSIEKT